MNPSHLDAPDLMALAASPHKPDLSHIWGEYVEVLVNQRMLVRSIQVYPGGATSLHRHEPEELMIVTSGAAVCELGSTPENLTSHNLGVGDTIHIPSGWYHRLSHNTKVSEYTGILELMVGDHNNGTYEIVRAIPARPGQKA